LELSILHVYIEHKTYHGILKFSIKRDFHNLCIEMNVYQINSQAKETLEIFKNNLISDPNNPGIINIIPTRHVLSDIFQLIDCEKLIEYIRLLPNAVGETQTYQLDFGSKLSCVVTIPQVKRIFNFFNSFVTNFALLDSVYKLYISMIKAEEEKAIEKEVIKEPVKEIPPPEPLVFVQPKLPDLAPTTKTVLESILEDYTINNIYRSYLIQHLFSYLRFISDKVKFNKETNTISINNLFSSSFVVDYNYILSVLNTIIDPELDNVVTFNQKKIVENIISILDKERQDLEDNLVVLVLCFIFYTYQYRFIVAKYTDYDFDIYFRPETQKAGLNYFIKSVKPSKEITIEVLENTSVEADDEELIKEISDKYKHLIPVSQTDFLDLAAKEYIPKDKTPKLNFNISTNTKILNIDNILNTTNITNRIVQNQSTTINTSNYNNRSGILNFNKQNANLTKAYDYFKQYVNNPLVVSTLKFNDIPKSVLNLFDYFKRNISNLFSNVEDNNTLSYYKILKDNIPASDTHSHQTFLYLIYNIIIPYYYIEHKKTIFIDCFL